MSTIYDSKKIAVPISGGINSAAVLCYLYEIGAKPKELHLNYLHFKQHSPDTKDFSIALFDFAKNHFDCVVTNIIDNDVLQFFRDQKMIPHPIISPCSRILKIVPMMEYNAKHGIELDLIGYVKQEKRRMESSKNNQDLFNNKDFPIQLFDDDWCFEIVNKHIGWFPSIYKILDENGKRIFKHNNCLPCKNMTLKDLKAVEKYYPEYMKEANSLSEELQAHWGRNANDYYTTFGKQDYETKPCDNCIL